MKLVYIIIAIVFLVFFFLLGKVSNPPPAPRMVYIYVTPEPTSVPQVKVLPPIPQIHTQLCNPNGAGGFNCFTY